MSSCSYALIKNELGWIKYNSILYKSILSYCMCGQGAVLYNNRGIDENNLPMTVRVMKLIWSFR